MPGREMLVDVGGASEWERQPELLGWRVPVGRELELPGRGRTYVREMPGPEGAPTVFLLHGLGATGALNWFAAFEPLAADFRVVALDHRGHGRGVRTGRFRLADCADDVVAVADALGIDRFIAIGYSMGGPIAQLTWHRHRDRVDGLVLCATSRNFNGAFGDRFRFAGIGMLGLALAVPGAMPVTGQGWTAIMRLVSARLPASLEGWALRELSGHSPRTVLQAAASLGRFSSHSWITEVDVPTAVVATADDDLVPLRRQLKLARSIPTAVLYPVDGDHLVVSRSPQSFIEALVEASALVALRAARWPARDPLSG